MIKCLLATLSIGQQIVNPTYVPPNPGEQVAQNFESCFHKTRFSGYRMSNL